MPLYAPSPAIPPGMASAGWERAIRASSREAARLIGKWNRTGRVGVGDASRYGSLVQTLQALDGLGPDEARAVAATLGPLMGQLRTSLADLQEGLPNHARRSILDLRDFLSDAGQPKVADARALAALTARTSENITADFTRMAASTKEGVLDAITTGMVGGLNPAEVAVVIRGVGTLTHARATTIARTEMADLYDASRLGWMQDNRDVVAGWVWRARPDACGICQILHGEVFDVEEPPDRHHNCRCVMVPLTPGTDPTDLDRGLAPRPRAQIINTLPKSWRDDLPDDLRSLVVKRDNPGWRPSLALRKPGPTTPQAAVWTRPDDPTVLRGVKANVEKVDGYQMMTDPRFNDPFIRLNVDSSAVQGLEQTPGAADSGIGMYSQAVRQQATGGARALSDYIVQSDVMNGYLRAGTPDLQAVALRDLIAGAERVQSDMVVFRGLDLAASGDAIATGTRLVDRAFMSTSVDARIAASFADNADLPVVLRIRVPQGTQAIAGSPREAEVILQANTTLKIIGKARGMRPIGGIDVWDAEVVLP